MASSNPTWLPGYLRVGSAQGRKSASFQELTRSCKPRATGNAKFLLRKGSRDWRDMCTAGFTHGDPLQKQSTWEMSPPRERKRGSQRISSLAMGAKPFLGVGNAAGKLVLAASTLRDFFLYQMCFPWTNKKRIESQECGSQHRHGGGCRLASI